MEVSPKRSWQRFAKPPGPEAPCEFESHRLRFVYGPVAQRTKERNRAKVEDARSNRAGFISSVGRIFRDRPTGRTPVFGTGDEGSNPSPEVGEGSRAPVAERDEAQVS